MGCSQPPILWGLGALFQVAKCLSGYEAPLTAVWCLC